MSTRAESILNDALALGEAERLGIAERLLETLPDVAADSTDDALEAELRRRSDDYRLDPTGGVTWEQLRDE